MIKKNYIIILIVFLIATISACTNLNTENNSNSSIIAEKVTILIDDETQLKIDLKDWAYALEIAKMPSIAQDLATQIENYGGQLSLFGLSSFGSEGIRLIAEPTNIDTTDYFDVIQFVNSASVDESTQGEDATFGNTTGIIWTYSIKDMDFKYLEYITKLNKYNIRITLWTTKNTYNENEEIFKEIIDSIEFLK